MFTAYSVQLSPGVVTELTAGFDPGPDYSIQLIVETGVNHPNGVYVGDKNVSLGGGYLLTHPATTSTTYPGSSTATSVQFSPSLGPLKLAAGDRIYGVSRYAATVNVLVYSEKSTPTTSSAITESRTTARKVGR